MYGKYHHDADKSVGRGVLVASSQRVLLIDKKPFFLRSDEHSYESIKGVTYSRVIPATTIVVGTSFGNIKLRTLNHKCAMIFIKTIEEKIFFKPGK